MLGASCTWQGCNRKEEDGFKGAASPTDQLYNALSIDALAKPGPWDELNRREPTAFWQRLEFYKGGITRTANGGRY
jgi:hypothetical protein